MYHAIYLRPCRRNVRYLSPNLEFSVLRHVSGIGVRLLHISAVRPYHVAYRVAVPVVFRMMSHAFHEVNRCL